MAALKNIILKQYKLFLIPSRCVATVTTGATTAHMPLPSAQLIPHQYQPPITPGLCKTNLVECEQRVSYTPEILNLTDRVKAAMLAMEPGSRYAESAYTIKFLRNAILRIAQVSDQEYTVIPLNGNAALATEATIRTMMVPKRGKLLVVENGVQTQRIVEMCRSCGIGVCPAPRDMKKLQSTLVNSNDISGVVTVHCDPYSGFVNPIDEIGDIVKKTQPKAFFIVEATISFGGMPIDMKNIDFLISNSGKSLEAAPGIAFVVAKRKLMDAHTYHGDSLVMDLTAQYAELERSGRFRFTPPSHVINAFKEALLFLPDEGGVRGRAVRYRENNEIVKKGMCEMGFKQLYKDTENPQGYLTTSFRFPTNPLFVFEEFQSRLSDYGYLICDSDYTPKNTFCVANFGDLHQTDMARLLQGIRQVCMDMRITVPIQQAYF